MVDCCSIMERGTLPDNEYAYDFMPIVDFRHNGVGV